MRIPGDGPSGIELRKKRGIEAEWEFLEESKMANSAGRIDQLTSLRFKTQMESKNLSRERKEGKFRKIKAWYAKRNSEGRNQ